MERTTIYIGSDHAGFSLKKALIAFLQNNGYACIDKGTNSNESTDYPPYAHAVAQAVQKGKGIGVLICGSGNGVNMTANKYKGVRSALCWNKEIVELARLHNNANILALPARYITEDAAKEMVTSFLSTDFEGGRHERRVAQIDCV
jgi:ribose 5-phosphate isomerase B